MIFKKVNKEGSSYQQVKFYHQTFRPVWSPDGVRNQSGYS